MKILFDQGTPAPLRHTLTSHTISTAYEMGWSKLENGDLLGAAEASFDAFITSDQNLQLHLPKIAVAVNALRPGEFVELNFS